MILIIVKFSIIVPTFETDKHMLEKCLDSIISQSYEDWETFLVDDGSSKEHADYCDMIAKKNPKIKVIHTVNGGVSTARNIGISKAKGEWILFADSDDWFELNAFEEISKNIEQDMDMLIFDSYRCIGSQRVHNHYFESSSMFVGNDINLLQIQALWKYAVKGYYPKYNTVGTPWGKVIKRSLISEHDLRFPTGMKIHEDTIFTVTALEYASQVKYIQNELYNYRVYGKSVCNSQRTHEEEFMIQERATQEILKFITNFKKNGIYWDIYYVWQAMAAICLSKMCADSRELAYKMEQEPYKTAIARVNEKYLTGKCRIFVRLLKKNRYAYLMVTYKVGEALKKLRNVR